MLPDGSISPTTSILATNEQESRTIYYNFGEKCENIVNRFASIFIILFSRESRRQQPYHRRPPLP